MRRTALLLALCLCLGALAGCGSNTAEAGRHIYATALNYSGEEDPKAYLEIAGRSQELTEDGLAGGGL